MRQTGLTLVELMITLVIVSFVIAGVMAFHVAHQRASVQEDISMNLQANLRTGISRISDGLRDAGYGVPQSALATWVPWVSGFNANPNIINGTGGAPDTLSVATCAPLPVATLTAAAAVSAATLSVSSTTALNAGSRRLINIGNFENAWVTGTSTGTLLIDTDPGVSGTQGLQKAYPAGTPICRVDVDTYSVDSANNRLLLDRNDGSGAQILVDEIQDFQVDTLIAGREYRLTLGGRSTQRDPGTNAFVTRLIRSVVTLRN